MMTPSRCFAEISVAALRHNAKVLRRHDEILAVVKANAYGHGASIVAKALEGVVTVFGVANLHEAEELRTTGVKTPILLLGACLPREREDALRHGFQVTASSMEEATAYDEIAGKLGITAHVHCVLDTGMGRMGFTEAQWTNETASVLHDFTHIIWEGLCSHFPSADEDETFTQAQVERFHDLVQVGWDAGFLPGWVHLGNSAGLLGYPPADFCNLSRPGLALYGVSPLPDKQDQLRPALTWKTRVLMVRELPAGHGISYGRTKILEKPTQVATLACGYGDGYPRQVSGKGAAVLIHGQRCPLLGRVTMDQIMVDVTGLAEPVKLGEEAVLLGTQGNETISAMDLAKQADTIAWHIFTGITARVDRVVV
jgi:alanine racemase